MFVASIAFSSEIPHLNSNSLGSDEHVEDISCVQIESKSGLGHRDEVFNSITLKKRDIFYFFYPLIKELKKKGFPIKYIIKSLQLIDKVEFVKFNDSNLTGTYNRILNKIQLGEDLIDPYTGKLKKFDELTLEHVKTIYHELWHAYYYQFISVERPLLYFLYKKQLHINYYGELHAEKIQNESYAVFIATAIQNYYQHYQVLKDLGRVGRERLYNSSKLSQVVDRYSEVLNYPAYGYFYSIFEAGVVESTVNLSTLDREYIFKYVFQEEIRMNFLNNFPDVLFENEEI